MTHSDVQTRTNAHAHIRARTRTHAHTHTRTHRHLDTSVRTVARDRKTMGSAGLERVAVAGPDIVLVADAQKHADSRSFFFLVLSFLFFPFLLFCFVLFCFVLFFI